jgi:PDZ domain-containing protein
MKSAWAAVVLTVLVTCVISVPQAIADPAAHSYLGVELTDAPPGLGLQAAMVARVIANSPADQAGLRPGDFIRVVNGHTVPSAKAFRYYVISRNPGDRLIFNVLRETPGGIASLQLMAILESEPGTVVPPSTAREASPGGPAVIAKPSVSSIPHYVSFIDPAEHAFRVRVPVGWMIGGRLVRYGPITIAPVVQALAPDGSILIQLGDPRIQDFSDIPTFRPGQLYTPGTSIMIVRRFENARQYSHSYGVDFQTKLGCENPSFSSVQAVPNPSVVTQVSFGTTQSAVANFSCTRNGKRYVGRVLTSIRSTPLPLSVGWSVVYLASFLARDDHASLAQAVWNEMRNSFAFDSAWNAQESRIAAGATEPALREWNSSMDLARQFDQHVINGEVTVQDPTTGTQSNIPIGTQPYYSADGLGHFYNSFKPNPPVGFHRVQPLP